ncbi:MAG: tetratricopeptide repeat protein, partial [Bacteroidota bacterium]
DRAEPAYNQAVEIYLAIPYEKGVYSAYQNLIKLYRSQGKWDDALQIGQTCLAYAEKAENEAEIGKAHFQMGYTHWYAGQPDLAIPSLEEGLAWSRKARTEADIQNSLIILSRAHQGRGEYDQAITRSLEALKMMEKSGSRTANLAGVLSTLGVIYDEQGQYPEAEEYYQRSIEVYREVNNAAGVAGNLINLGIVSQAQGKDSTALAYYQEGIEICEKIGEKSYLSNAVAGMAGIYQKNKQYPEALASFQRGLALAEEINYKEGKASNLNSIGAVYMGLNKYPQAAQYALEGLALAQELGSVYISRDAAKNLYNIYKAQGKAAAALPYYELFVQLRDSIQSEQNQRATIEQELQYSYEKQAFADSLANVQQQAIVKAEYQQQLTRRNFLLISGLLLALGIFLFIRYRNRQKLLAQEAALEQERELDALKSRFFTNISHEFRTPLTVILGMANQLPTEFTQTSSLIRRNGTKLLRLINQLLDLSRMESHEITLNPVKGDIVAYLRYLLESFRSLADERKITLTHRQDVDEWVMDYDAEKMQDIFYNLLSNALKYTPEGGSVTQHIRLEAEGKTLAVDIADTGPGIPAEEIPRIFDRFYQGAAVAREGSSGVGLALVKGLVDRMGGEISVRSELGKGSTFSLRFPVQRAADTPAAFVEAQVPDAFLPPMEVSPALGLPDNPDRPQILIIEDNPDVITYLGAVLGADYQLLTAMNGPAGLELAQERIPDLIVCDVMMPGLSGFEVTEQLKTDARTSHIPVILLTAKATQADKLTGLKHGADAYLTKPFDREELLVRIEKLLALRAELQARYRLIPPSEPVTPPVSKAPSLDDIFLQKIRDYILDHLDKADLSVHDISDLVNLSHTQMYRKLKALTGQTPTLFIRSLRLQKARQLLETTQLNVSEVAYDVGFNDPNYFTRVFSKEFGVPPSEVGSS